MYELHPLFNQPDEQAVIWRYMSFGKLVSLLATQKLFFTRLDKFEDKYEGTLPQATYDAIDPAFRQAAENWRTRVCVSCWSLGDHESHALWRIYVPSVEGVAIRSTFARLRDCFGATEKTSTWSQACLLIGKVRYEDFATFSLLDDPICASNGLSQLIYKRTHFAYESELRAVLIPNKNSLLEPTIRQIKDGWNVPVDINTLVEEIRVAPTAKPWFIDAVKAVVQGCGLSADLVSPSEMDIPPSST